MTSTPISGLHFAGIDLLPKVLHRLQGAGTTTVATTVATNHNLDAIKAADWLAWAPRAAPAAAPW